MTSDYQMITGFFDTRDEAKRAADALKTAGVPNSDIHLVAGRDQGGSAPAAEDDKGFFETLTDWFMPNEDRDSYAEGLRRGGHIVRVDADASHRDVVFDILDREGTVNMDEREAEWRAEGWTGSRAEATSDGQSDKIDVVEENLKVGKRQVDHGRVRVRSYTVEDEVSEDVNLRQEKVDVDRRKVDRPVEASDKAFKDRTIEVEEKAEEAVVSKEARVTEEINVNRKVKDRTETVSGTVRRTEVDIDDDRKKADTDLAGKPKRI